jgi:ABC-type uncharacterized transport system permease subunit
VTATIASAFGGALLALAFVGAIVVATLGRLGHVVFARRFAATFLRMFSVFSGFESVVLYWHGDPLIIGLEELARAFGRGDVMSHTQAPPRDHPRRVGDDSCDGNA